MQVGDRFDKYTIESVLGEGGMATVYLARHDVLESLHALKVLRVDAPAIRQRLLAEGKTQASIRHPNVVAVTDILEDASSIALVMEYVEGTNLEKLIDGGGAMGAKDALALFQGIARGVSAAHRMGVVHRDLKPANILLQQTPSGYIPKVTDFGLVKILESSGTQSGVLMGTPEYMSPEQVRDSAKVTPRSDLWSLGALLYEMLTGRVAFEHTDILQVYTAIVDGDYVHLDDLLPTLPPRAVVAVDRLLQVEPEARFASCDDLLAYLYPDDPVSISREPTQLPAGRRSGDLPRHATPTALSEPSTSRRLHQPPPARPRPPRAALITTIAAIGLAALCAGAGGLLIGIPAATPTVREVMLLPRGPTGALPADLDVSVRIGGATYDGHRTLALGPEAVGSRIVAEILVGSDCGSCPDDCPSWCSMETVEVVVPEGGTPVELPLAVRVPAPVPARVTAAHAQRVLVDGTPSSLADGVADLRLAPGRHTVRAERGEGCEAAPDCSQAGSCPTGCEGARQRTLEVAAGAMPIDLDLSLPAPAATPGPTTAPRPAAPAPSAPPSRVSNASFAAFVDANPDWAREAAIARGVVDEAYLSDWSGGPPAGVVTRIPWAAAKAFCASRGGLLGVDDPPLTWEGTDAVKVEWRATPSGGLAWRRFDGVTSTSAKPSQTAPFTGIRCRR